MDHRTTAEKIQECCSGDKPQALGLLLVRMKNILPDLNSYELGDVLQILLGNEAGLLSTLEEHEAATGPWIRGVGDILDFVQLLLECRAAEIEPFLPRLIEVLSRRFSRSGLQRKKAFCMLVLCERVNLGEYLVAAQVPRVMVSSVNERYESQSVRAVNFQVIGRLCRQYPELMTDFRETILNAVKATDKDSITVQLGALLAMEGFLYHFIAAVSPEDKPVIRQLCLHNLDLEGSLAIQAAALRVVSRHADWLALETQQRAQMWQLLPRHPAAGVAALQAAYAALQGSVDSVENILKEEILIQLDRDGAAYMREAAIRCMQALGRHADAAVHLDRWSLCLLELFHTTLGLDAAANEDLVYAGFDLKLVKAFEECKAVVHCVAELERSEVSLQRYTDMLDRCRLLLEAVIRSYPLCPQDRRRSLVAEAILMVPECVRNKIVSKQLEECRSADTAVLAKLVGYMLEDVPEELEPAARGVLGQLASHVHSVLQAYSQSGVKIISPDASYLSNICTILTSTLHLDNVKAWILNQLEALLDRLLDCLERHGVEAALLRLLAALVVLGNEEQLLESTSGWLEVKLGLVFESLDVCGHADEQHLRAACEVLLAAPAGLLRRRHFEKLTLAFEVFSENPDTRVLGIGLSRLDDWVSRHDDLDLDPVRRLLRKLECNLDRQNKESRTLIRRIALFLDEIGTSDEELQTEQSIQDVCQLPLPGYPAFKIEASKLAECAIERGDIKSVTAVSLMLCCSADKGATATLLSRCLTRLARSGDTLAVQLTRWSEDCGKWQSYVDRLMHCLWHEVDPIAIDNCVTVLVQCCQHSIDCGRGVVILDYIIMSVTTLLSGTTRNTGVFRLLSILIPIIQNHEEIVRNRYPALLLASLSSFTELPESNTTFDGLVKEFSRNISVFTPQKLQEFLELFFEVIPKSFSSDFICTSIVLVAEICKKLEIDIGEYIKSNQMENIRTVWKDFMDSLKQIGLSKMDIDNGETSNVEHRNHGQELMSKIANFLCFLTNLVVKLKVDVSSFKKVLIPELLLELLESSGVDNVDIKQWNKFCECVFEYFIAFKIVLIADYGNIVSRLLSQLLIKQPSRYKATRECEKLQKKCYEKYLNENRIVENVTEALVEYIRSGNFNDVLKNLGPNSRNGNTKNVKASLERLGSVVDCVPSVLVECTEIVEMSGTWLRLVLKEQWSDVDMEKAELFKIALNTSLSVLFISKTKLSRIDLEKFVKETDELKTKLHSAPRLVEVVLEGSSAGVLVDAALEYVIAKKRLGDLEDMDVNILDRVCGMWPNLQTSAESPQQLQHTLQKLVAAGATPAQLEPASNWLTGRLAELGSGCTEGAALMELLPRVVETFDDIKVKRTLRSYRAGIPLRQREYEGHVPLALRALALGVCARPALLHELLAVLTDVEPAPWWRHQLSNCMRTLAADASTRVASARLLWGWVCARDTHTPLRLVIARALLVPLLASFPSDACDELFLEMKDGLVKLVMTKPSGTSSHQITSLLLGYVVGYTLAEVLILKVNAELLKSASALGSEGNWPFCRAVLAAFRIRRDMEPPASPGASGAEEKLLAYYYREFYQAGLRCSIAALTRRESDWKSYEPLYRVQDLRNVVDEGRMYRVRLQAENAKWLSVKAAKANQRGTSDKIFLSTLSDNVLQYDFIKLEESAAGKEPDLQVHSTSSSDSHDLESHPCLAAFVVMTTKGEHSAASMLRDTLADATLARNVRLFAAQIICSGAESVQIHQKALRCAILQAVESRWGCAKEVVNSVDVQLLQTLISWWAPDLEYSQEEQTLAGRILEMLVEMTVPVFEDRKKTEAEGKDSGIVAENVDPPETTSTDKDVQQADKPHVDTYLNRAGRKIVLGLITDLAKIWSGFLRPSTAVLRKMLSGSDQDHAFTILSSLLKSGIPVDSLLHQFLKFLDDSRKPIVKAAAETLSAGLMLCRDQRLSERCGRDLRKKMEGCYAKDPTEYVGLLQGLLKGNSAFKCCDDDVMYLSDLIPKVSPGTRNRCLSCLHQLLKSQDDLVSCDALHTLDYPGILLEPECTDAALEVVLCVIKQLSAELRAGTLAAVLETCAAATSQRRLLCYQILLQALDCDTEELNTDSGTQKDSRKRRLGEDASSTELSAWMKVCDGVVLRQLSRGIADHDPEVAAFVLDSLSEMMSPFREFKKRFRECAQMPTPLHGSLRLLYHSSETLTDKLSAEPLIAIRKRESNNEAREGMYPNVQIPLSSIYDTLLHAAQRDEDMAKAWLRAVIRALLKEDDEDNLQSSREDVQLVLVGDAANPELVMLFSEEWSVYNDVHAREIGAKRKPVNI